jgi:hypothetical protein
MMSPYLQMLQVVMSIWIVQIISSQAGHINAFCDSDMTIYPVTHSQMALTLIVPPH